MRRLLYINDTLVDLYPDTVIAQTLQAFDIGQLGSVKANYTNRVKLPKTATNRRALQFSDDSKSSTGFPYTSYSTRYIENGIEIIRNGRVVLLDTDPDFILNIFSGPIGFFDYIKTKTLWDMDTTDINSGWNDSDRDSVRNTTTGIVAPLVDDGVITYNAVTPAIEHTGSVNKHPWIYYHTVIDKIFESAGYAKSGSIFSDDKYLKLAMPMRTTYSPKFLDAKYFSAAAPGTQVIVNPASYTSITFDQVAASGADGFYNGTNSYDVTNPDSAAEYFAITFRAALTITVTGGTVDLVIHKNNFPTVDDDLATPVTNVGTGTYHLSTPGTDFLKDGDSVAVRVIKNTGTPTVTITNGVFDGIAGIDLISPAYVYFNHLFENINQADLIKDFSVRFNVKMIERNGEIICKTMDEILANTANAVDWTMKRAIGKRAVGFSYNGIAQSNYLSYPTDDLVEDLADDYGKGLFTVANENITESQTIYRSMFAMSGMIMFADRIFIARIPAGANEDSLGIRLLYLRQNTPSVEPNCNVVYAVTARSDYKVAYFIDPRQTNAMHWQFFIDNYYEGFVSRLQKAKAVTRDYNLSPIDIHAFDQLKPVFDSGEYFIATKINNFQSGKITEVELFKI